jgi:hypothetical protein
MRRGLEYISPLLDGVVFVDPVAAACPRSLGSESRTRNSAGGWYFCDKLQTKEIVAGSPFLSFDLR